MKIKIQHILYLIIFMAFGVNAQNKLEVKAEKSFNSFSYTEASKIYKYLVKKEHAGESKYLKIGDIYYNLGDYLNAQTWYSQVEDISKLENVPNYLYRYAQATKTSGDYGKSDEIMEELGKLIPNDNRYTSYAENRDYIEQIEANSGRFEINNLFINSPYSDFAPSMLDNDLFFSSVRDTGWIKKTIHLWDNKSFPRLYKSTVLEKDTISRPKKIDGIFEENFAITTTSFSKDGSTVYFTRNNITDSRFNRDEQNINHLKIYRAKIVDGKWTDIIDLPFNGDGYSNAHPALSPDGKTLFFSSDMPGSYGESDIYSVTVNEDNTYGAPVNLGAQINTASRETFPFMASDGTLYFASDGHPGLGGLDIFATRLQRGSKVRIQNLGRPINSPQDDFSFIIDNGTGLGYFSSSRPMGKGGDDIYGFIEKNPIKFNFELILQGKVVNAITGEPLNSAMLFVSNEMDQKILEKQSDSLGRFNIEWLSQEGNYSIITSFEGFEDQRNTFSSKFLKDSVSPLIIEMNPIIQGKQPAGVKLTQQNQQITVGTDLKKYLGMDLEKIYFEFNKFNLKMESQAILDKIIDVMNSNPSLKIEIKSHTDSRGTSKYNRRLSELRAQSTLAYFVRKGIEQNRLKALGVGELDLINDCADGIECTEEQHLQNRRSEFIVVEN